MRGRWRALLIALPDTGCRYHCSKPDSQDVTGIRDVDRLLDDAERANVRGPVEKDQLGSTCTRFTATGDTSSGHTDGATARLTCAGGTA